MFISVCRLYLTAQTPNCADRETERERGYYTVRGCTEYTDKMMFGVALVTHKSLSMLVILAHTYGALSSCVQATLLGEARTILTEVISRDTSSRGATTALAHHALGNVIGSVVELHREHCPSPSSNCPLRCPSPAKCMELLHQSCRFEFNLFLFMCMS